MNYSQKLLTELKATECLPSNYMAAKIMQVSEACIHKVDKKNRQFSEENVQKIAKLMNIDPHEAVLHLRIDTANPETREVWREILAVYQIAQAHAAQGLEPNAPPQKEAVNV